MKTSDLENRFTYHTPVGIQTEQYATIRSAALSYAKLLDTLVPDCRELSLAITKLEECVMHANAGIARNPRK